MASANEYCAAVGRLSASITYLDVRLDEKERQVGIEPGSTPRTIEGPLYVAGARSARARPGWTTARDKGEILFMDGQVTDTQGEPVAGALVEVWHANSLGNYSYFDKSAAVALQPAAARS